MFHRRDTFYLTVSNDSLAFEAGRSSGKTLFINKQDGNVKIEEGCSRPTGVLRRTVYGILGITELPLGKVAIVVTKRVRVGEFDGHVIWRLESCDVIPLNKRTSRSPDAVEAHKKCLGMLQTVLMTPYFYFSYTSDLTNSRQRAWDQVKEWGPANNGREIYRRVDKRFLWNEMLLQPLLSVDDTSLHSFLLPIIHGAVFIHKCIMRDKAVAWALITRRSRHMVGTRFFARGADSNGNVANFCETEQLVEHHGQVSSFVQTRGSMPMVWEQVPNLKYKPNPVVFGTLEQNESVFKNHFREQVNFYGRQVAVNLIDQKKAEGMMERQFCQLFGSNHNLENIHYEAFDFHKECSKMRYERLSILMDQLANYKMGYFLTTPKEPNGTPTQMQTGGFRTNCIDCLDRTNVVQSLLASQNLSTVLHQYGVLSSPSTLELEREAPFQNVYRNAWADHANLISVQYAGTGALKTDYTRTGVRTKFGLAQDGWNSSIRYVKNNFCDGFRTDALRYFVGDLSNDDIVHNVADQRHDHEVSENAVLLYLPKALLLFIVLALMPFVFSRSFSFENFLFFVLASALTSVAAKMMLKNNKHFVNFPISIKQERVTGTFVTRR